MTTLQRAFREGHEVASHSYSHPNLSLMPLPDVRAEVVNAAAAIRRALCIDNRIFRPPYGALTPEGVEMVEDMGYMVVNWNLETLDHLLGTGERTAEELLDHVDTVMDDNYPGSIIHLQHDLLDASVDVVADVISRVTAKGYRFVTIRECVYGTGTTHDVPRRAAVSDCAGVCVHLLLGRQRHQQPVSAVRVCGMLGRVCRYHHHDKRWWYNHFRGHNHNLGRDNGRHHRHHDRRQHHWRHHWQHNRRQHHWRHHWQYHWRWHRNWRYDNRRHHNRWCGRDMRQWQVPLA